MKKMIFRLSMSAILIMVIMIACKKDNSATATTSSTITALTCSSTSFSAAATINEAYAGTATVPYTGGNGTAYAAGTATASTGITGLTATLVAGTLASGAGNLTYSITGTATTAGTAVFAISFGGQTCSMSLTVGSAATVTNCTNATTISTVISKINAFETLLTSAQLAVFNQTRTKALAINWSNLPCGAQCRNGLEFNTLTTAQVTAALAIVQAATGTDVNQGYDEFMQIRAADDILNTNSTNNGTYSSSYYFICVLGTPSTTGVWQLQYGGHHSAVNVTYSSNTVAGATPMFEGVEPKSFVSSGVTYAPLDAEHTAMVSMLGSLTSAQLASAKLSTTFSDVLLGPKTDGQFPTTKAGVIVGSLTTAQQALVTAAMKLWVNDVDATTAACLMSTYTNELSSTYIAYSTDATLSSNTAYVRIDGPSVWIEFVCQSGVVFSSQIHYHSVWRDHARDYGGSFTF